MDAIVSVDSMQRIIVFNASAERMFRCKAQDAIGQPLEMLLPERFRAIHKKHVEGFGDTGVTSRSMWRPGSLVGLRADGEEFPIEATISQVETGGRKYYTVILRDITERRQVEEQLRAALVSAEAANTTKSQFLAMMSHELRTPLNAIAGYAQLLELGIHGYVSPAQLDALARIQTNQKHLLALINNILNFARLETGHLEYEFTEVIVADVLAEVEPLIQPQMEAKGVKYEYSAITTAAARVDVHKLRQIILNLLTNAVKFTPTGGRVRMHLIEDAENVITHVSDTGRGIAPDRLNAVFEPFVQLERSLTNPSEGSGLGLTISRDLARGMGGTLTVASEPGVGSTFSLILPRLHH